MARRFKITEEQYRQALSEGITINADVSAANGDVKQAIDKAKQEAMNKGLSLDDTKIEVDANYNESKLYTMAELKENYHKRLKENSKVYSMKEFSKMLKK